MAKIKNEFEIVIVFYKIQRLEPGIHQYKFIVDGEWCFSPDDEQIQDDKG